MLPSIFGETLFDNFFNDPWEHSLFNGRDPLYGKHAKNLMKTDVKEQENGYEIAVDLPGFKKEDIKVELENGYLTISAAKALQKDEKGEDGRYIRQERYSGQCSRSFYIGEVEPNEVKAKYEDGVLRLTFPKKEEKALPANKTISIA